ARQETEASAAEQESSDIPEASGEEDSSAAGESETEDPSDSGQEEKSSGQNPGEENGSEKKDGSGKSGSSSKDSSKKDKNDTDKKEEEPSQTMTCTISISCASILDNMDKLEKGKEEFVPSDGWILEPTEVEFTEGDSVFDVLLAVCRAADIHMEHSYTPLYGSEYVEGINQLYEFDCGDLSGWMYNVDSWFPNYGCDKYILSDGETIQWVYTCDLGRDVGDNSMWE
ncbi:MAG TPA: hypothetical protein DF613_08710, partial [Lachnospiraceae bacterium]|nr:hypothetical protein [Lachnospiraceae bacterium]